MSEPARSGTAIRLDGVSKMYKVFPHTRDSFFDAVGLARLMPWRRIRARLFWSLRDVSLELKAGSRLGVIGRNGAGKSTLLRLITGALAPTEGQIAVQGKVQALFDASAGFHPDFTGLENIHAALTYQGLDDAGIAAAIADIAEFTELDQFLSQPIKTYSLGMQARLAFATATATRPDILIVDEVLGAGDAYFAGKSSERMKALVEESGATVLLVTHAMDQIQRYCEECIWLERGRIVKRGPSMEVVNAYEAFIHEMEDRRLRAKNRRKQLGRPGADDARELLTFVFSFDGRPGAAAEISEVALLRNGVPEETLRVGDVQDADMSHAAAVQLNGSEWSEPRSAHGTFWRALEISPRDGRRVEGRALISVPGSFADPGYAIRIRYQCSRGGTLRVTAARDADLLLETVLPSEEEGWTEHYAELMPAPRDAVPAAASSGADGTDASAAAEAPGREATASALRWPGEGSLTLEQATLLGSGDVEQAVFGVGGMVAIEVDLLAHRSDAFRPIVAATLLRPDGVFISNLISDPMPVSLAEGQRVRTRLEMAPINLGDGRYVFSLSLFEGGVTDESRYDLLPRALEFQVVGNEPLLRQAVFRHPFRWMLK